MSKGREVTAIRKHQVREGERGWQRKMALSKSNENQYFLMS